MINIDSKEWVKYKLGLTDDIKDMDIDDHINDISIQVMNYCNIKKIPKELDGLIRKKVLNILQYENSKEGAYEDVKSITEGDTKVDYFINQNNGYEGVYFLNAIDKKQLKRFRRLRK